MPVTLEDSNGSNATPWPKLTISKDEIKEYFVGATGGLRKKSDNSVVVAKDNGVYQLEDGEIYKVMVPQGKTFATAGLPPLGPRSCSNSNASENDTHEAADITEIEFMSIEDITLKEGRLIWEKHDAGGMSTWGTEREIQGIVADLMRTVIQAVGLKDYLQYHEELSVFRLRPDVWIVTKGGAPIGVVEVKQPDPDIMTSKLVHGQILDYMLRLFSFHGVKHTFGIVTTYEQWRFYALGENSMKVAKETKIKRVVPEVKKQEENLEELDEDLELVEVERTQKLTKKDILYGSKVYEWNNPQLPKLLGSIIEKMYYNITIPVPRCSDHRMYIAMNEDMWTWERVEWGKARLNYHKMPTNQPKKLLFLEDFRGGIDGRVWLACTLKGEMCAIKFDHHDNEQELQKEAEFWRTLWEKKNTQVITLAKRPALMMPYMKLFEAWGDDAKVAAVKATVQKLANLGYVHNDLKRSHVAYASPLKKKGSSYEIVFIDTRQVKKEQPVAAVNKMLSDLRL